jgi:LEA14-like dessication related protein
MAADRGYHEAVIFRRLLLVGLLLSAACSTPEPPRLVPQEAAVTSVGAAGVGLVIKIQATNPNRFELSAQSVTGKATLAGKWQLGTVRIDTPVVLPGSATTTLDVPMTLPWTDMQTLATLASSPGPVPYVFDGTVTIGGGRLHVDLPFSVSGTITREQAAGALLNSLPKIPGLTVPR